MRRKYTGAAVFALAVSLLFVGSYRFIAGSMRAQQRAQLDAKWAAVKGYLRIEPYGPEWFYDSYDPEEARIVGDLRRIYFLADADGRPLRSSEVYRRVGLPNAAEVRAQVRRLSDSQAAYQRSDSTLLRSGIMRSRDGAPYFLSIGEETSAADEVLRRLRIVFVLGGCLLTGLYVGLARWTVDVERGLGMT